MKINKGNNFRNAIAFIFFYKVNSISGAVTESQENSTTVTSQKLTTEVSRIWPSTKEKINIINDTERIPVSELYICDGINGSLSSIYCTCNTSVISCDFSHFTHPKKEIMTVHGNQIGPSVKRLCICNSPRNLQVIITNGLTLHANNSVHRVDIYKMKGPLHLHGAFTLNFGGDLYLSNITYLDKIKSWEFQRGNDMPLENVENLECCSKINAPQSLRKPILYLENTTIGTIEGRGIDDIHLWKTIIFKRVNVVHGIQRFGIIMNTDHFNISITECHFNNVYDDGIVLGAFDNALIAKTLITNSSSAALEVQSKFSNSSLVIIDNYFKNSMILRMDAHRIINWFNIYDFWDAWTFANVSKTIFPDRIFSIEYNTVEHYHFNDTLNSSSSVIYNENIIGRCNCTQLLQTVIPDFLQINPSRCDFSSVEDMSVSKCFINVKEVISRCHKEKTKTSFSEMCKDSSVAVSSYHVNALNDVKIKANGVKIKSPFISQMLKNLNVFHTHQVFKHSEEDEENYDPLTTKDSTKSSAGHTTLYVFLGLFVTFFIGGSVLFLHKKKRQATFGNQQGLTDSYDVLVTSST